MNADTLHNYEILVGIDSMLSDYTPKYPFTLNQQAKYTQHQITLYQSNYCHKDIEPTQEQPSVAGGALVDIVLIDI